MVSGLLAAFLVGASPAAAGDPGIRSYHYDDLLTPFFATDPAHPDRVRVARNGSNESSFAAEKSTRTLRVFVLGSHAALIADPHAVGALGPALQSALPGRDVELVDCSMEGYDSRRDALIVEEALAHSPDLFVFVTGQNEGLADGPLPVWVPAAERERRRAAFAEFARGLPEGTLPARARGQGALAARHERFERTLRESVRRARKAGALAALVVPGRNLRSPPETSKDPKDPEFLAGWLLYLRSDPAGAAAAWTRAVASLPPDPGADESRALGWWLIARAREATGALEPAREAYEKAAYYDDAPMCGPQCQEVIRKVGREEGAVLVDADAEMRGRAAPRVPGLETFVDRFHWRYSASCSITGRLVEALRADPRLRSERWDEARVRELQRPCQPPMGPDLDPDDIRTFGEVVIGSSHGGFRRPTPLYLFYLDWLSRRHPDWLEDLPAALALTRKTRVMDIKAIGPDSVVLPRLYWHRAELRLIRGETARALRDYETAMKLDPDLRGIRLGVALAHALRRDKKKLAAALKAALADDPEADLAPSVQALAELEGVEDAELARLLAARAKKREGGRTASACEVELKRAEEAMAARDAAAALAALGRARSLEPDGEQLRRIGQYYRLLGRHDRFLEMSDALFAANPDDPDLWLMRAEALLETGRAKDALEAVDRAEALRPGGQAVQVERLRRWAALK